MVRKLIAFTIAGALLSVVGTPADAGSKIASQCDPKKARPANRNGSVLVEAKPVAPKPPTQIEKLIIAPDDSIVKPSKKKRRSLQSLNAISNNESC